MSTPPSIVPQPDDQLAQMQQEIDSLKAALGKQSPKSSAVMSAIVTHWKSTANGVLALFITTGLVLLATGSTLLSPKMTVYITIGLAVARAWTGLISKDASALTAADISKQTAVVAAKQA